ncbi:hypothetical protein HUU53_05050, partial [Candidatus Micrarchaeota archaeon]|nr:hypothetical protein [Candidatus Micrarchaeota archaeon]
FMISYDGVYDCESGTSNARRHYLFWNPLGQPTNAVAHAISSCTTYYSDASGSDNWNRNPVSHPSTIKAGFNDCTGLNSPNQMITITSEAK